MYYDFLKSGQCVIIILISKSFLSILFLNGLDFFLRNTVQIKSIERLDLCLIVSVPCVPTASNRYETISASEASSCGHRRYVVFVVLFSLSFLLAILFIYVTCNNPRRITRMILFIRFVARIATRSRARNETSFFFSPRCLYVRSISFRFDCSVVNNRASSNTSAVCSRSMFRIADVFFVLSCSILSRFLFRAILFRLGCRLFTSCCFEVSGKSIEHLYRYQFINCEIQFY